jgi:ABC-type Fe3+ transport system permease subunit
MVIKFPVIVSAVGSVAFFVQALKLHSFKVSEKPPASRAHLSREGRQRKIVRGSWISFGLGCFMLVGAFVLAWLGNR